MHVKRGFTGDEAEPSQVFWEWRGTRTLQSSHSLLCGLQTLTSCHSANFLQGNADYLKTVPYSIIFLFTALQFGWLTGIWALVQAVNQTPYVRFPVFAGQIRPALSLQIRTLGSAGPLGQK
eukprot:1153195-Pelagomonas_calceolata.AAC.1